ncbi:hypothetical protein AHF37_10595 [Paragonimus kellicotti]|nr:hypothetical protein AHF37_10595 [Paragonimus kellicotti]
MSNYGDVTSSSVSDSHLIVFILDTFKLVHASPPRPGFTGTLAYSCTHGVFGGIKQRAYLAIPFRSFYCRLLSPNPSSSVPRPIGQGHHGSGTQQQAASDHTGQATSIREPVGAHLTGGPQHPGVYVAPRSTATAVSARATTFAGVVIGGTPLESDTQTPDTFKLVHASPPRPGFTGTLAYSCTHGVFGGIKQRAYLAIPFRSFYCRLLSPNPSSSVPRPIGQGHHGSGTQQQAASDHTGQATSIREPVGAHLTGGPQHPGVYVAPRSTATAVSARATTFAGVVIGGTPLESDTQTPAIHPPEES